MTKPSDFRHQITGKGSIPGQATQRNIDRWSRRASENSGPRREAKGHRYSEAEMIKSDVDKPYVCDTSAPPEKGKY